MPTMDDDERLIADLLVEHEGLEARVGTPMSTSTTKRAAARLSALKAERDTLKAEVEKLRDVIGPEVHCRNCGTISRTSGLLSWECHCTEEWSPCPPAWRASYADDDKARRAEVERTIAVEAERDRMREALREAEAAFRGYAELHASKSPPAIDKALANGLLADRMLAALSQESTQ